MLTRRLAGPSRALFLRHLATAAAAEAPPPPAAAAATSHHHHHALPSANHNSPRPADPLTDMMAALVARTKERSANRARNKLYETYTSLSPMERASLSPESMRSILRAVVPRHDSGWHAVKYGQPRKRKALNDSLAEAWGRKLRVVIGEMVERNIDTRADWHFVLQCLLKVGAVSAVESVWQVLPAELRTDREFAELRLGTVSRWAQNMRAAARPPPQAELDKAYRAFWDAFAVFQDPSVKTVPITHRLLCVASADLAVLMHRVGQNGAESASVTGAFDALHRILRAVLERGYGLDIDAIPLSADRIAERPGQFRPMPPVVLNAVLEHLSLCGMNAAQLFATFDVLTTESAAPSKRAFEEEEDDDAPTLASETAKAENDPDRTNWWGRKVNRAEYFDAAAPAGSPSEPTPASAESAGAPAPAPNASRTPPADYQTMRFVSDYLPHPTWPRDVVPDATRAPQRQRYDADSVLLLLKAARSESDYGLLARILEVSVLSSFASDAAWLSTYLATPPAERTTLPRPGRISPEWFAHALGGYTTYYDRFAPRTVPLLTTVLEWTAQKIEVLAAAETAGGEHTVVRDRVVLPPLDVSGKEMRFLRNRRVYIAPDELARLYRDLDEFAAYLPRAGAQRERRKGWKVAAWERKAER